MERAIDVARERYFISPSSYMKEKPQALFRNLGHGKKGLPCMIWEEDVMEEFESWIELSYLDDREYAEELDLSWLECDTNRARERLESLYVVKQNCAIPAPLSAFMYRRTLCVMSPKDISTASSKTILLKSLLCIMLSLRTGGSVNPVGNTPQMKCICSC